MQVPIGLEDDFEGLVDLVQSKAYYFHGSSGSVSSCVICLLFSEFRLSGIYILVHLLLFAYCSENVVAAEIPADMEALAAEKRRELIETVSEVDDKLADAFLSDEPISSGDLEVCWKYHAFQKDLL